MCEPRIDHQRRREIKHTLIIVRIMLTEPKTPLAGVMLVASFARFMASMAVFNVERVPSRRFGRCGFPLIVETQGSWVRMVWYGGCVGGADERPRCHRRVAVQTEPSYEDK